MIDIIFFSYRYNYLFFKRDVFNILNILDILNMLLKLLTGWVFEIEVAEFQREIL